MTYPVIEQFTSWQGEGMHMGHVAHFIRLYGCNQACSWCDTPESWKVPPQVERLDAKAIASRIVAPRLAFVVVTGGEPTIHHLDPLLSELCYRGWPTHIETAGHMPISVHASWITLSPKRAIAPLPENVKRANEFKIVVDYPEAIQEGLSAIERRRTGVPVYLQPEWSKREDPPILAAIGEAIATVPYLRAGYQLHKLYGVR